MMKRSVPIIAAIGIVALAGIVLARMCGMHGGGMMGGDRMGGMSMARHHYVMRHGIDAQYASRTNPLQATETNVNAGRQKYQRYCAACHGPNGRGNGPAGKNLDPRPTDIATFSDTHMADDDYLYWTIAEGGAPVGSGMPPFKNTLDETGIWQIILYLRHL